MPKYILYSMMVLALALSWRLSHFKAFNVRYAAGTVWISWWILGHVAEPSLSHWCFLRCNNQCWDISLSSSDAVPIQPIAENIYLINKTLMPNLHHIYSIFRDLGVTILVFNKNWQGISQSPVRNEFHEATVERWNRHSWPGVSPIPCQFL